MANWQKVTKGVTGRGAKPDSWYTVPGISLGKTTIAFNEAFQSAYMNGKKSVGAFMFFDLESRKIGFKIASPEEIERGDGVFNIALTSKNKKSKSVYLASKKAGDKFPDCLGKQFRCHLNAGERIIEVDLSPDNIMR